LTNREARLARDFAMACNRRGAAAASEAASEAASLL